MRSRMLPDSMRVGSFTIFCNQNSRIISSSLLGLLALFLVLGLLGKLPFGMLGPGMRRKNVIIVKTNYDDAGWWSERNVNCVVPMGLLVMFASSAGSTDERC